ncbi:glutamate--cysteine ligase [Actinoplanes sp. TBRC 11911]|uniref:glutamate--cysteine ligase n=1 Tax=Actinoplanes sp. TBRC 11911 TaxID=2729386 RepID=UPI00145CDECA|nr:glutamate--cysteine ligase [Actinoplanes sp. TBRC 11911]NMO56784.1 glutamate--cysteine ligase [Actinoplanes sp. TBRC 11911]
MGKDLATVVFAPEDRVRFRQKVHRCLDVLADMLDADIFDTCDGMTGLEIELNLIDSGGRPAMRNNEVLAHLADPAFQTELGRFNLEFNAPPQSIIGRGLADYERDVLDSLDRAVDRAAKVESGLLLIGMLPTLTRDHLTSENLSADGRYLLLNREMSGARGEQFSLDIAGVERLRSACDSIVPEAACTSAQFHLQVPPDRFARFWNASQAIAGIQVAIGANAPFFHGRRLWAETRIVLFEQATDTRPAELKSQGVRPRVWFGERWITSVFDLFEENVRYFPPLLPLLDDEDPVGVLESGGVPRLSELRMHNGTVYRWNRPVYDVSDGRPHLRIENRVLPSGPTVVDLLANAAFYFGLIRQLSEEERPIWSRLPFATAESNFRVGARHGMEATVVWPTTGEIPVADLVRSVLLPKAYAGLDRYGVDPAVRDRLLGVIDDRCAASRNGATWQTEAVREAESRGLSRPEALHDMLLRYQVLQQSNEPVHTWPV